jgi:putative acetyltransferase
MKACRELTIRPYLPNDLDAVIAVFLGAVRQIASRDYNAAQIDAWARVERDKLAISRLSRTTLIAVIGEDVVGFTDLEPEGHLDMMYVHAAHQRRGVATALLKTVEVAATDLHLSRIFTEASITARPFFETHGFHVVARQFVHTHGQNLTNFRMEKLLP